MSRLGAFVHRVTRHHIGWRGDVLLTFAFVDVFYGWALFSANATVLDTNMTYQWVNEIASLKFWGMLWWVAAAVCAAYAFRGPDKDRPGFEAAIGIKVLWGLLCLGGWAVADVSISSVAIWLGFARLVWRIAVWTEPDRPSDDAS